VSGGRWRNSRNRTGHSSWLHDIGAAIGLDRRGSPESRRGRNAGGTPTSLRLRSTLNRAHRVAFLSVVLLGALLAVAQFVLTGHNWSSAPAEEYYWRPA